MLKFQPKKRLIVAILTSSFLWNLSSQSVQAAPLDFLGNNPLSDLLAQMQQFIDHAEQYIDQVISEKIQPLEDMIQADLQSVFKEAKGALGLPDPIVARQEIEDTLSETDIAVNPLEKATNEADRQITRASAAAVLGAEGQQQTAEELTITQDSVDAVQQQASEAASEVVTQNVMKQIAQQNAQMSSLLGGLRKDSLQTAQRQELTNLNLTNISRSLDGQNQVRQSEVVGAGMESYRISTGAILF